MNREYPVDLIEKIEGLVRHYPKKEAALVPVLRLVQEAVGCISPEEEAFVAGALGLKPMRVREVASFYTMLTRRPMGRYHIQVCLNLSCSLLGAGQLVEYLEERLGIRDGETSADGRFSLSTVECLGACDQAPCLMINSEHYGNLDRAGIDVLLAGIV